MLYCIDTMMIVFQGMALAFLAIHVVFVDGENQLNKKPHIIVIVADDLGYTDVGFHGGDQIPTPNLDQLAETGVILDNYYTAMICTPSRASLLTGRHPMQLGMQHSVIFAADPFGLSTDETLLPQYLKKVGYRTHAVGKWHLGFCHLDFTPTQRGFDSHFGFWGGKTDYYSHVNAETGYAAVDFWDDLHPTNSYNGSYGTEIFGHRAEELIMAHNQSEPFFLYLAHQAPHNGNPPHALKAPEAYLKKFSFINHPGRRNYSAMLSVLDDTIGNLTRTLKASGMYDNTLIVFTTDNGGPADGFSFNYASNYPLRGMKYTEWEGGVRGVAFIHSPLLKTTGRVSNQLMHISDWLPTLLHAAGAELPSDVEFYGMDQWNTLLDDSPSPRNEIIHNFFQDSGALMMNNYKLVVVGTAPYTNSYKGWYPEQEMYISKDTVNKPYIDCGERNDTLPSCTNQAPCLFHLPSDPCEYNNLAGLLPDLTKVLLDRLMKYNATAARPRYRPPDSKANPAKFGGHWSNWLDKKPIIN